MATTTNKLLKTVNTQLNESPSLSDCETAIKALQDYTKKRKTIEAIFTEDCGKVRTQQVDQYFQIRRLLEVLKITFPNTKTDDQFGCVKYFNLEWHGNKTARLYWSASHGWTVTHKNYDRELTGVWEEFDLEETLECNGISFTEYVGD